MGSKLLKTSGASSFFEENKQDANTDYIWVVAEPDLINPNLWVESKFGNGIRFNSSLECNRFIRLNTKIDNIVKIGLRAKKLSELKY